MLHYIGVDVSKARLDVDFLGKAQAFANDSDGMKLFIQQLKELHQKGELALVLCEATGGYEKPMVNACRDAQLPVHVAHANKVKNFAKSKGLKAKTDPLDARILTEYARLLQPKPDEFLLSKNLKSMSDLLKRREQLIADKKREQSRSDKELALGVKQSIDAHIDFLDKKIKEIDQSLADLKEEKEVAFDHELLTSIPAIGSIVAYYLQANLPELKTLSLKQLAALVGVAPYNRDSGTSSAKRFIQGGRSRIRQILYMAAMTAIRYNPPLKSFYERLINKGKPGKLALTAVMRKLISMASSVLKRGAPWEEKCPTYKGAIVD